MTLRRRRCMWCNKPLSWVDTWFTELHAHFPDCARELRALGVNMFGEMRISGR